MGIRRTSDAAIRTVAVLLGLGGIVAGCATAPYQKALIYKAQLAPFADCALASLERDPGIGPRFSKADIPTSGEIRLAKTVQDAPYVTVTLRRIDASQVIANVDILSTLLIRESLRDQTIAALDRCAARL